MKLGILTYHSQQNYGGLLQCWALKAFLEKQGHEVQVIDRWFDEKNKALEREYPQWSMGAWAKFFLRSALGLGDFGLWLRHWRTKRFLQQKLNLTPYHFVEWADAPPELGVDAIVVGSDQVWYCGEPGVFLLEGANLQGVRRVISYAASFGRKVIPPEFDAVFQHGWTRFSALSCREREGVEICKRLGFQATQVVDPTLLLTQADWGKLLRLKHNQGKRTRLFCYFMSVDAAAALPVLENYAERINGEVDLFVNKGVSFLRPIPRSLSALLAKRKRRGAGGVHVHLGAGPLEFAQTIGVATQVITDSFHGLMFSAIFGCNARFIRPSTSFRAEMFGRIAEFAAKYVRGPLFFDNVSDAMRSLEQEPRLTYNEPALASIQETSRRWLLDNLL